MTKKKFKIMIYIRIVLLLALIWVLILTKHMEKVKAFRESIEEIWILKDCKNVEKTKDLEKIYDKLVESWIIDEKAKFEWLPDCWEHAEYTCVFWCLEDWMFPQRPSGDYDIDHCKVNFIRNRSKDNNIVCGIE